MVSTLRRQDLQNPLWILPPAPPAASISASSDRLAFGAPGKITWTVSAVF